jgi:hypothetical protein
LSFIAPSTLSQNMGFALPGTMFLATLTAGAATMGARWMSNKDEDSKQSTAKTIQTFLSVAASPIVTPAVKSADQLKVIPWLQDVTVSAGVNTKEGFVEFAQDTKTTVSYLGGQAVDFTKEVAIKTKDFTVGAVKGTAEATMTTSLGFAYVATFLPGITKGFVVGGLIDPDPVPAAGPVTQRDDLNLLSGAGQPDTKCFVMQQEPNPSDPASATFDIRHHYRTPPILGALPHSSAISLAKGEKAGDMEVYFNEAPSAFVAQLKATRSIDLYFHGFNVLTEESLRFRSRFVRNLKEEGYNNASALISWSGDVGNNFFSKMLFFNRAVKSAAISSEGVVKAAGFIQKFNPDILFNAVTHSLGAQVVLNAADRGVKYDTVIMLVPAVDKGDFAPGGRYAKAIQNIKHLVVVSSESQRPVFIPYMLARFSHAMGEVGPVNVQHPGFTYIDATKSSRNPFGMVIDGHSDIYGEQTLKMISKFLKRDQPQ